MGKKKKKEIKSIDEIEVKLKKIGNIRPGVYLTVLYALGIVLIVFLVFFLPGIRNPGSIIQFTTIPESAAVYVDGKYAGTTPVRLFVSAGKKSVAIGKTGYSTYEKTVTVESRLFASLIFPKKQAVSVNLGPESPKAPLLSAFRDFTEWSSINSFHYRYQPEPVISKAVEGIFYGNAGTDKKQLQDFFTAALPYVDDEALLKDFLRGYTLSQTHGRALSPATLLKAVSSVAALQDRYKRLPDWTASALSSRKAETIVNSSWYQSARADFQKSLQTLSSDISGVRLEDFQTVEFEGLKFVFIPRGSYSLGTQDQDSFPVVYKTPPFYISSTEISYRAFAQFLEERPQFRPSEKQTLVQNGLVTEDYLQDWEVNKNTELPVAYVSHHIALEFCKWLETKLPSYVQDDFTVRLPDEYQWETAAAFSFNDAALPGNSSVLHDENNPGPKPVGRLNNAVLSDFFGNVWEWCDNWYAPSDFVLFQKEGEKTFPDPDYRGVEKSVRGGSWAAMEDLVSISSRGSQPPDWCTAFLGFRPAIVVKQ